MSEAKLGCTRCNRNQPSGLWYDKKTMKLAAVCATCGFKFAPRYMLLKNYDAGVPAAASKPIEDHEDLLPQGHRVPLRLHPKAAMALVRCITHDQTEKR